MPIYKYRCQNCGFEFEKRQTYLEKILICCPECKKPALQRVPQMPAIVFKGSGWYSTDHRKSSPMEINKRISEKNEGKPSGKP